MKRLGFVLLWYQFSSGLAAVREIPESKSTVGNVRVRLSQIGLSKV